MYEVSSFTHHRRRWRAAAAVIVAASAVAGTSAATEASGDAGELLVWTDATRQAGFELYQEMHPEVDLRIETYDPASLLSKIQLFNQTGEGWPDVVFSGQPNEVASLSNSLFAYAQPLDDLIGADVLEGFGAANDGCVVDGTLFCLKNDLAQTVLWYDQVLMDEFGYTVPTTWEEYAELGQRVAVEHPGYLIGTAGSAFLYYDFLWSSGCPLQEITEPQAVTIDTTDERCTRVSELLDPLLDLGVISRQGPFDPETVALAQDLQILMMPGASWYGDFVFKPEASYAYPEGRLAAAPYPAWDGEPEAWSGGAGGGIYLVSRHSENVEGAVDVIEWMATSNEYQLTAPTFPAYGPAAEAWSAQHADDPFYAADPTPALLAQAGLINPSVSYTSYPIEDTVVATVAAEVRDGGHIADGLEALDSQLTQLAQSAGYAVN